jgi:CheY-like chemotaxis protein/HPt (histidine-containing phosphotransfer) domain-containing protein
VTRKLLEHLNHELRSPMTVVVGMTELLMMSPLPPEQRTYLDGVKQASDVLLQMLDELIDFSRLQSGTLKLSYAEFEISDVIGEARARLDRMTSSTTQLDIDFDGPLPERLAGDVERLGEMIAALVRSAGKFRSSRAYRLRVAAAPAGKGRASLHFALSTAAGNAAMLPGPAGGGEEGEWLTMQSIEQTGYRGAGLGLPLTAGLAALMNGRLWAASDIKQPVIFRLTCEVEMPVGASATRLGDDLLAAVEERLDRPAGQPPTSQPQFAPSQTGQSGESLRVLLAEDTRANQEFFRSVLERAGHQVVAVADGQHALRELETAEAPFDVALVDLQMPVMDGHELAGRFRQSAGYAARPVPLVALTADQVAGDARLLAGGFDAAITKPCGLGHLLAVIDAVVRRAVPPAQPPSAEPVAEEVAPASLVDYRGALSRLGGDELLFRELASFFLEDAPAALARARDAVGRGDASAVEREAHSLKGLAANFGAPVAVAAAAELQRLGHGGGLGGAEAHLRRLDEQIAELARELTAYQAARRTG